MAIRFIDTGFYKSPFVRGLEGALKGLYGYIICDCSAAGIWAEDLEVASIYIGFKIDKSSFEKNFVETGKAIFLGNKKYFFPDFIQHQYPKGLQKTNPAHQKIIAELLNFKLIDEGSLKVLESPSQGAISNSKGNSKGKGISKSKETREEKIEILSYTEYSNEFINYLQWAEKNLPDLLKFEQPLTDQQLQSLFAEFKDKGLVRTKLEAMGNTKGILKKYKSVYHTCRAWCKISIEKGYSPAPTPTNGQTGQDVWSKTLAELNRRTKEKYGSNETIHGQID